MDPNIIELIDTIFAGIVSIIGASAGLVIAIDRYIKNKKEKKDEKSKNQ